jgi:lipid-binding SYLF domain-containing protein
MRNSVRLSLLLTVAAMIMMGCETAPRTESEKSNLADDANAALNHMKADDPSLGDFMSNAYGYAMFPSVGKGGLIAGGAYGRGVVYEQGNMIGYSDLAQATVGAQLGGQTYSELITFQSRADLNRFTTGKIKFDANASAVALKSGAGASARYTDGVAIFVRPTGGLMAEAAIGGQQFTFQPKNSSN